MIEQHHNKELKKIPLLQWIWRSYWKTALIPLLLVEVVFLVIFFLTNNWSTEQNITAIKQSTLDSLTKIGREEAEELSYRLADIECSMKTFAFSIHDALNKNDINKLSPADAERMTFTADGTYYSFSNNRTKDGAALYYSSLFPQEDNEIKKMARLATLQPLMKYTKEANPIITTVFLDTFDSLVMLYPYPANDLLSIVPPQSDATKLNVYYEADEQHNPSRGICWTNAYLDLIGNGWMVTCIAPIYNNDRLECVAGIDVTIADILKYIMDLHVPYGGYALLLDKDGTIIALPSAGENDWGIKELIAGNPPSSQEIQYKPEIFNINKRPDLAKLSSLIMNNNEKTAEITLKNKPFFANWHTVDGTNWKLMLVIPQENVFANINNLKKELLNLGHNMIIALVLFYIIFFSYLYANTKKRCSHLNAMVSNIKLTIDSIGKGNYFPNKPQIYIEELNYTSELLLNVGKRVSESLTKLALAKDKAEQANNTKNTFLSTMSHELRTPLNAIIGFTYLLQSALQPKLTKEQNEDFQEILNASEQLLLHINQMLDLSAMESGNLKFSYSRIELNELIESSLSFIHPLAEQYQISVIFDAEVTSPAYIFSDKLRIRQVLYNLLSNAIKYNRTNGYATISLSENESDWIITVADTGVGIKEEFLAEIFNPFYRIVEEGETIDGAGIGLSVTAEIIKALNGSITVTSKKDVGSEFCVFFTKYKTKDI